MLTDSQFYDLLRAAIWVSVTAALPILAVALVVGLAVGLFQALTSVQEMTLTFVPKLAAIAVTFWVTMGYMTQTLTTFFRSDVLPMLAGM